jgi:hypothetical protein
MNFVDYYRTNQVYGVELNERMRRMLAVKAKGAHRVLDVGCGRGLFPSELHRLGAQAYGSDVFDPDSIAADGGPAPAATSPAGFPTRTAGSAASPSARSSSTFPTPTNCASTSAGCSPPGAG